EQDPGVHGRPLPLLMCPRRSAGLGGRIPPDGCAATGPNRDARSPFCHDPPTARSRCGQPASGNITRLCVTRQTRETSEEPPRDWLASLPGSQHGDLGKLLERAEAVLGQPADYHQASPRPPCADHPEVDVDAVAGDDVAKV